MVLNGECFPLTGSKLISVFKFLSNTAKVLDLAVNKKKKARHWWLTPIILATREAEIRRIVVQRQPRQIVPRGPIMKIPKQK
jgi:hypothetical protein